jgi:hypothetical protein
MCINTIIEDSRFSIESGQISLFDSLKYILGGEAIFTIFPIKQGIKYVFKCNRLITKEGNKEIKHNRWFLNLLTGPDNTKDFTYVGTIDYVESKIPNVLTLRITAKSGMTADAPSYKLFDNLLYNLQCVPEHIATLTDRIKVYHDGSCSMCGRPLTDIVSVAVGRGPVCAPDEHKSYKAGCKRRGIILPKSTSKKKKAEAMLWKS